MTVSSDSRRREYQGNGVTTIFNGPMAFQRSHVQAFLLNDAGLVMVPPANYDVERLGQESGTRVIMRAAPPVGAELILLRTMPYTQEVDVTNQGAFHAETIEKGFDTLAMQNQQLADAVGRSLRMDDASPEGGGYYDANGNRIRDLAYAESASEATPYGQVKDEILTAVTNPNTTLFLPNGAGAIQRTIGDKLRDLVTARDFGAVGDGATDDTSALQAAMDYAASKGLRLRVPAGIYITSAPLQFRSHAYVVGDGMDSTIIRFADTAHEDHNMLQPAAFDMSVGHCYFADFTLDGNRGARVATGTVTAVGTQRPGSSGFASMSAHDVTLERVKSMSQVLHCFDDCSGGDINGSGNRRYVWPEGPSNYSSVPSMNNRYIDCVATDWGDDGFTTHYSNGGRFEGCQAIDGSDWYASNLDGSCCFEFDDGSLDYVIENCYAKGSARGIIAKSHAGQPGASMIRIHNNLVVGCGVGISCAVGSSDIGYDYQVVGNVVRDPVQLPGRTIDMHGIRIAGVHNVLCTGNSVIAHPGTPGLGSGIYVTPDATGVVIDNYLIENWPGSDNTSDNTRSAIRIASSSDAKVGSGRIKNPGFVGISWTGGVVGSRSIGPVDIAGESIAGSIGIYTSASFLNGNVSATIDGFDHAIVEGSTQHGGALSNVPGSFRVPGFISTGRSSGVVEYNDFMGPSDAVGDTMAEFRQSAGAILLRVRARGNGSASYSGANSITQVSEAEGTGRSINAGGTINASGADYAEYMELQPHLWGNVPKGALLGLDANGLLTDRWSEVVGPVLVKSTAPNLVGGDAWGTEDYLCAKYGVEPVGADPDRDVDDPDSSAQARAAWVERKAQMADALETERLRWDRMALCGQVPVNVPATPDDVGKFLVAVEGEGGGITGEWRARGEIGDAEVVGRLVRIEDGRAVVLVR